jgi:hypothetical protein
VITLNTNKGLIKVESWEDIESRPGFIKDLNPKNKKLDSIIGRYIFKDKIRCGLSNCHTPHAKGYIVTTKDGYETNIGKDCGKTYFGVDFETLSKKFDRDVTESENREKLWNFSFQIEELEERLNEIRTSSKGGNWIHKNIQPLLTRNRGCPDGVVARLSNMVKTRNNLLTKPRLATNQEVEDLEAIENRRIEQPHYIEEPIAEISGLEALYPENDLRKLLVKDLESNIKTLKAKDIDQLDFKELRYWSKWIGTVDTTIDKVDSIIESGKRLLAENNLKHFLDVLEEQDEVKVFRKYIQEINRA